MIAVNFAVVLHSRIDTPSAVAAAAACVLTCVCVCIVDHPWENVDIEDDDGKKERKRRKKKPFKS